ncbi:hypothetical protein FE257_007383, partial [Aspergillus nanangensis]
MANTGSPPPTNGTTPSRPNTPITPLDESRAVSPRTVEPGSFFRPTPSERSRKRGSLLGDRPLPSLDLLKKLRFTYHEPLTFDRHQEPRWATSFGPPVPKTLTLPSEPSRRDKPQENAVLKDASFFQEPIPGPIGCEIMSRRNAAARLMPSPFLSDEIYRPGIQTELGHWYSQFRLQMWSPIASMMGMNWEEVEELAWQAGKE